MPTCNRLLRGLVVLDGPLQMLERALDRAGIPFVVHQANNGEAVRYWVKNTDVPRAQAIVREMRPELLDWKKYTAGAGEVTGRLGKGRLRHAG